MNKRTADSILDMKVNIVATNYSMVRHISQAKLTTEHLLSDRCDYAMILIQTNTIFNMSKLEIESEGKLISIPIKHPLKTSPKPVVFCVSPQFAAEQWQTFLAQVHISKFYGAYLHIYVLSMVESYFKLIREYEKLGYLSIEPWLTIKFSKVDTPVMEPNRNVELRAQTAAHTDCLLMYKEAAKFIGSLDMDDLLIPVNSNSYYEEFEKQYNGNRLFSALNYLKHDFETIKSSNLEETSILQMVKHAVPLFTNDTGKSFVLSERYNSTWAHWSRNADFLPQFDENKQPYFTSLKYLNIGIFHLKKQKLIKNVKKLDGSRIPINPYDNKTKIINEENLNLIEKDLKSHLKLPQIKKLASSLPKEDFYMPIIFKCYNETFYHVRDQGVLDQSILCINAYDCDLPQQDNLPCIHSDAFYHSGERMDPITYHFATKPFFSRNIGCFQ
ncbi:unnamed protein product [Caenorhabditis angaria]|uniref:Glycosyltransferase family 92 protein n=1 Tax=Caenorhabditis angaria TaxID=860376 RepID=A0A9P1IY78_9PELO|nr:unnamed protein product [Caenorhabditis angaria]